MNLLQFHPLIVRAGRSRTEETERQGKKRKASNLMAFSIIVAPVTAAPLLLVALETPSRRHGLSAGSLRFSPALPMTLRRRRASRSSAVVETSDTAQEKDERVGSDLKVILKRFWKIAAPYWSSEDKVQARLRLAALFALTLGTTGISVGFNFLGRDFYNALASKDQEQFTKQLMYYLGAFAGGIPVSILLAFV
ncbi:hypothetical protein ZIOFF_009461 [Zingiber officinale]|uniref:Uncharacterized protein n=1 Tax=Zingiber officinale TaxID=94328 RepID=A0A8J5HXV3_ZINOF|nr:hypothetical protein ZIOFF_009461 [Zingiber officinale]